MGIISLLRFQEALARLIERYVAPTENDYFAY
jgi:hypothetical protein